MKHFLLLIAFLGSTSFKSFAEPPCNKGIWKATQLTYPSMARLAQIQGEIRLKLEVAADGEIISVSTTAGPDALTAIATKEIRAWRYASGGQRCSVPLAIHYSLEKPLTSGAPVARVEINTPFDITVTSSYPLPTGNPETMRPKK